MKRFLLALLLLCTPTFAADHERIIPRVGGLCVLESAEPVTWMIAAPKVDIFATKDGLSCFVDTSDARERIVYAIHGAPVGTPPVVDAWTVKIGDSPTPPGPVPPGPDPEPEPTPPEPQPDTFAAWVTTAATSTLPKAELANAAKAAEVYAAIASECGETYFTGPAIRLATSNKFIMDVPSFQQWKPFFEKLDASNTEWLTEYRDAAAYKARWTEISQGLQAVKVPASDSPETIRLSAQAIELVPGRYQVRNGRLLRYECIQGQRCRWVDDGEVLGTEFSGGKQYAIVRTSQ